MSLPWFPFHLDAYTGDTMHLTTEEHGAYLLLMIAYYRTGKPLPGNERALAAICKLPIERWYIASEAIQPFFRAEGGLWHHDRIDAELRDASEKHAARIAQRTAAAEARWGSKAPKSAGRNPKPMRPASEPDSETRKTSSHHASRNADRIPPASGPKSGPNAHIQEHIEDDDKDAGGRKRDLPGSVFSGVETDPKTLTGIEDALTGTQPVSMGIPIDLWERPFVAANHIPIFQRFFNEHAERGTFSRDWPSLWQAYLDAATAPPKPPAKRKAPPRVETDKRPEPIPGVRVLISDEAFAVAKRAAELIGVTDHPVTVGMPALMQTWMASWPPDTILTAIERVMSRRRANGETGPPGTMKYFENAIAREFAESKRPLPVAVAAPRKEITTHGQRTETKSLSNAADRLIQRITAGGDGGTADGGLEGETVAGPVPQVGRG